MTEWSALVPPTQAEIDDYADSPLWLALRAYLAETYHAAPQLAYSACSWEPGWNVKFKKGSRALCTVYLRRGYVTAMVSIGPREGPAVEATLLGCTNYTQGLYRNTESSKLGRWLMIDVTSREILEDVKALLRVRAKLVTDGSKGRMA